MVTNKQRKKEKEKKMDSLVSKVFLILFVVIGVVFLGTWAFTGMRSGMETGNQALSDVEKMNTALLETEFTKYDATEITGSQVINAIKKYEQEGTAICITVNNGRASTVYVMTADLAQKAPNRAADAKKKNDLNRYINPSTMYLGEVVRDTDTGTITGVTFTKATP